MSYDFSGWATRNNLKCSDGRVILKDAFKDCDGMTVPMVWNHQHNDPNNVLGHCLLENRDDGVWTYGTFNDSESGRLAKQLVQHGDITGLSIYANKLRQQGSNVLHGAIREVSLVLAGANPGALIDTVIEHSGDSGLEEEAVIFTGEEFDLYHADDDDDDEKKDDDDMTVGDVIDSMTEEQKNVMYALIGQALEDASNGGEEKESKEDKEIKHAATDDDKEEKDVADSKEKTVGDVIDSMTEEQKNVMYALIGQALEDAQGETDEEDEDVKHNVFDNDEIQNEGVLMHSDQEAILDLAKSNSCGSLQTAIQIYSEDSPALQHGIDEIETLFPDYKNIPEGAPTLIERDQGWVTAVMNGISKSPISRIRTRQADIRDDSIRAFGYQTGAEKKYPGNVKLLKRTTDPQTVYRKDMLNRDDIIDITDFDVVEWQYGIMRQNLNEEIATAIMIGDGREEGDEDKISEEHIRSIWHDDDLYTIHADVDIEAAREELQGSNTSANFGENYIYAEAIITAALYAREDYKGSGSLDFYCTPHLLNVMLLARDLNGRRIYDSKTDLASALNVGNIYTAEQFEGKTRTTEDGDEKQLLGLFVNLKDYQAGSTKGGEITRFNQFDIDFNQEKYLIETRLSGALTRVYSAIALEMPVTDEDEPSPTRVNYSAATED